jgi:signal transduction histidine kinase
MNMVKYQEKNSPRHNDIKELSKPFWILLVFCFFGFVVFGAAFTHFQNRASIQASEKLFRAVLSERYERLSQLVLEYGYWDEAVDKLITIRDESWVEDNFGSYLKETLKISTAHILDDRNNSTISNINGKIIDNADVKKYGETLTLIVKNARGTEVNKEPVPVSGILATENSIHVTSAVRMTTYFEKDGAEVDLSTNHVLLFTQEVDKLYLEQISKDYLLSELRISPKAPSFWEAGTAIKAFDGSEQGYFVWNPELPGSRMIPAMGAAVAFVFVLMTATAIIFVQRTTQYAILLDNARAEADRANRTKSEYLNNVTHEMRTPLNALIGFSGIMQRQMYGPLENEKYRDYVDDISSASRHMLDVVNDLLDLAKIETGELVLEFEDIDLNETVVSAVNYVQDGAREKAIELRIEQADDEMVIRSNNRYVRQILLNLLSNAIKFTKPGGSVTCSTTRTTNGGAEIKVIDTGIGIRDDELLKVLEPFGQATKAGEEKSSGTGLGLPITKILAEKLGGTFTLESMEGEGTTATIVISSIPRKNS